MLSVKWTNTFPVPAKPRKARQVLLNYKKQQGDLCAPSEVSVKGKYEYENVIHGFWSLKGQSRSALPHNLIFPHFVNGNRRVCGNICILYLSWFYSN